MTVTLQVEPHPSLDLHAFVSELPTALGEAPSPEWLVALLRKGAAAPVQRDEAVRQAVRDMLRHGGYKPTGRGKPASEYLVRAAEEGTLGSINAAVDAGNAVALHGGLPVSVVDLDRARAPFRVALGAPGASFVFNASGQVIDVEGLACLHDADGACANAVKDAQRTKTDAATRRTLSLVWGVQSARDHGTRVTAWYREVVQRLGATTELALLEPVT